MFATRHTFSHALLLFALAATLMLTACDSMSDASDATTSDADAELMARVVADALVDESEGMLAEAYDLTAGLSASGMTYVGTGQAAHKMTGNPEDRGRQHNYSATYDPATGEHTIHYERSLETPRITKSISANLVYIFTDSNGGFIEFPAQDHENVAAIDFEGIRAGSVESTRGPANQTWSRAFEQEAAWQLTGFEASQATIVMEGTQRREGTAAYTDSTGASVTVMHTVTLTATDVTILKPTGTSSDLEGRLTGTLSYSVTVEKTVDGETTVMTDEGTIELEGNGQAILRFLGLNKVVRINLEDGQSS